MDTLFVPRVGSNLILEDDLGTDLVVTLCIGVIFAPRGSRGDVAGGRFKVNLFKAHFPNTGVDSKAPVQRIPTTSLGKEVFVLISWGGKSGR